MGSDLVEAAGLPLEWEINGRTYKFSPLTPKMLAQVTMRKRSQLIREVAAVPELSSTEKAEIIRELIGQATSMLLTPDVEDCTFLLYLAAKPNHPEITEEEFTGASVAMFNDDIAPVLNYIMTGSLSEPEPDKSKKKRKA